MAIRISRSDEIYGTFDISTLESALELDAREEMSSDEVAKKDFTEKGIIPNKVASSQASNFGLRHAYFDIWKPVNSTSNGVWHLQKDADGNEWIVRAEGD